MKIIFNHLMLSSLAAMVLALALGGCYSWDESDSLVIEMRRFYGEGLSFEEQDARESWRKEEERIIKRAMEKEKMKGLATADEPPLGDLKPVELAPYEDEPEQTDVIAEKKYINIAGRWAGTSIITDHTGPDYGGGVTYEYGNHEELVFSVSQASNTDQATVTLWGTECTTTFNSESRKLEFTYKTYIEGSLIVTVFKGTVASDLRAIEGTLVQTWPDGTQFKGTWRVRG